MIRISSQLFLLLVLLLSGAGCNQSPTAVKQSPSDLPTAAATVDPASVASLSGTVHFAGPVPQPQKIDMSADSGCRGQNQSETVLANDGHLANVLVYVKDGTQGHNFTPPTEKVTITQEGCRYQPHLAAVMAGQPVEFVDKDETLHNIHPMPKNNGEWNQSQMPNGGTFTRKFASPEVMIPVKCNQHPWMKMYLSVMSNPFFAVTGKDGSFALKGLPPGTYTIAAVHEKFGEKTQTITVGPRDDKQGVVFAFQ